MTGTRILALFVALAALTPARNLHAQLGSITKKAKEAVKGKDQADPKKDAAGKPIFNEDVLELTQPVLDNFIRAMKAEIAGVQELKDLAAAVPTQEQYDACTQRPDVQEETQKIMMVLANVPDNISQAEFQKISQKMQSDMAAMVKKKCGVSPGDAAGMMVAKREEIQARVLAVGGGSSRQSTTASLTLEQYNTFKERTIAFCMSKLAAPNADFSVERIELPGKGTHGWVLWVYTSEEAKLLQARCKEIVELGKQVM